MKLRSKFEYDYTEEVRCNEESSRSSMEENSRNDELDNNDDEMMVAVDNNMNIDGVDEAPEFTTHQIGDDNSTLNDSVTNWGGGGAVVNRQTSSQQHNSKASLCDNDKGSNYDAPSVLFSDLFSINNNENDEVNNISRFILDAIQQSTNNDNNNITTNNNNHDTFYAFMEAIESQVDEDHSQYIEERFQCRYITILSDDIARFAMSIYMHMNNLDNATDQALFEQLRDDEVSYCEEILADFVNAVFTAANDMMEEIENSCHLY